MSRHRSSRRIPILLGITVVLGAAATAVGFSRGATPVDADAIGGLSSLLSTTGGTHPEVSGDGRFVVFQGAPGPDDSRSSTVWLRDQQTNVLTDLAKPTEGLRAGDSVMPTISDDGCVVAMTTEVAFDLFRDDDRGTRWDVYRSTMPSCGGHLGDWELVSTTTGAEGQASALGEADATQPLAISGSGAVVAYVRPYRPRSGIVDPLHVQSSIEVVDLSVPIDDFGRTSSAAGMPAEAPEVALDYHGQSHPALSGDGSVLVFSADATANDALPAWTQPITSEAPIVSQVYAWDRNNLDPYTAVRLISQRGDVSANASATAPAVSSDGRFVAFESAATNLVALPELTSCGTGCPQQVYHVDRDSDGDFTFDEAGTVLTTMVSAAAPPALPDGSQAGAVAGNANSSTPTISADGNTVVFSTQATNLLAVQVPGMGETGDGDLLVSDVQTGVLRRAFAQSEPVAGAHAHPSLSASGRVLVSDSLVAGQLSGKPEVGGRQALSTLFIPTVSLAPLDLGTVTVLVPGPEWFVYVLNDGPGTFTPRTVTMDNPDFAITGGSCLDGAAVPAGKSCSVKVMLTPSVAGPLSATLTVAETGYAAITLTAPINGAGGEPALEANPNGVDLPPAVVATLAGTTTIEVTNVWIGATSVSTIEMQGANPKDFAVTKNGCTAEIALGASCFIEVSFTPTDAGRRSAVLTIGTATGQYTSSLLSGEGHYEAALWAPPTINAGSRMGVGGSGFPARTTVTISWASGSGRNVTVTTDKNGTFLTDVLVTKGQRGGPQVLVAQAGDGTSATAEVRVDKPSQSVSGAALWPAN